MRRILAVWSIAIVVSACAPLSGELDRDRAIAAAREFVGGPIDGLISAERTPNMPDGSAPSEPDHAVWRIAFKTSFMEPCGPAPGGGRCRIERVEVVIGSTTGREYSAERAGRQVP